MELLPSIEFGLLGILAGLLAGLLGISGGVITVPVLYLIFKFQGFSEEHIMHLAIGTSLASMIFNTGSALWFQQRKKAILWTIVRRMLPGLVVGSVAGALVATILPEGILKMTFGAFACCIGVYFFFPRKHSEGEHPLPTRTFLNCAGFGVAAVANVLGIGGSIFTVPILIAHKIPDKKAIACSAATGFFITLMGALSYLYFGLSEVKDVQTIGFLYLPAFFIISITSFLMAPLGVVLSHSLPPFLLRRIFSIVLVCIGLIMIFT
jgi:uncharacterized membrane protein YfcA